MVRDLRRKVEFESIMVALGSLTFVLKAFNDIANGCLLNGNNLTSRTPRSKSNQKRSVVKARRVEYQGTLREEEKKFSADVYPFDESDG